MDVIISIILVCGFLNIIPWLLLLFSRPDLTIYDKLDEDGAALAGILQSFMVKLQDLEEIGSSLSPSSGEINFGDIIAKVIQQKMNPVANDIYERDDNGQFYGQEELKEITPKKND